MTDILERLQDQSLQLSRRSFDSVDAGLAANVADAAIDEIERLREALGQIASKNDLSGVSDDDLESAACNALHECELIARSALSLQERKL